MAVDLYEKAGGDAAWKAWFDRCSVARVRETDPRLADGLAAQIDSAMCSALSDHGISRAEMGGEPPHMYFDSFFLAGSQRKAAKTRKPLKLHCKYRISLGDRPLKEFVCGTLFGSQSGRVRDIVRDWIASARGWKPHTITLENGKRQVVWEGAGADADVRETERAPEGGVVCPAEDSLDRDVLRGAVREMLVEISREIKVEETQLALLLFMTAQDLTLDNSLVLEALGVGRTRAYTLKRSALEKTKAFFEKRGIATNDLCFATELLAACSACIEAPLLRALQDCKENNDE